jgi:hypothetical protein
MTVEGDKLADTSWESALGPKTGVPWATDDQWASLKSEATRMSIEMEAKANAPEARRPVSRLNTTKPKLQPEEMKPAGETSMVSVYWEPAKGIPDKDIVATNPYEVTSTKISSWNSMDTPFSLDTCTPAHMRLLARGRQSREGGRAAHGLLDSRTDPPPPPPPLPPSLLIHLLLGHHCKTPPTI